MICDDCKILDIVFVYNWEFHSQCQEELEYIMRRNEIIRIVEMNSYSMNITFDTALLRNTPERNGSKNACSVPTGSFCCLQDHAPESSFTISSQFLRMNILPKQHIFVQRRNKKNSFWFEPTLGQKCEAGSMKWWCSDAHEQQTKNDHKGRSCGEGHKEYLMPFPLLKLKTVLK